MKSCRALLLPALVLAGAGALTAGYLAEGLRYVGPYATLPDVRWPVAASLFAAYVVVLAAACVLLGQAAKFAGSFRRFIVVSSIWLLVFWIAAIFAPGIPYLGLVLACKAPSLCPDAANPIVWALSGVVRSQERPFSPAWVVLLLGASVVLLRRIRTERRDDA